jgi:hypothetical protein
LQGRGLCEVSFACPEGGKAERLGENPQEATYPVLWFQSKTLSKTFSFQEK